MKIDKMIQVNLNKEVTIKNNSSINELINEIDELKNKLKITNKAYLNKIVNIKNIKTIRKKVITEINKIDYKNEDIDNSIKNKNNYKYENKVVLPNKDIELLINILLIYKNNKLYEDDNLYIESILNQFLKNKINNQTVIKSINYKIDKAIEIIVKDNINYNYFEIINNLETKINQYIFKIKELKLANKDHITLINDFKADKNLKLSKIGNFLCIIEKLEKDKIILNNKIFELISQITEFKKEIDDFKENKLNINTKNIEIISSLKSKLQILKEEKDILTKEIKNKDFKFLNEINFMKLENSNLQKHINKYRKLLDYYINQINIKENYINEISTNFNSNYDDLKNIYQSEIEHIKLNNYNNNDILSKISSNFEFFNNDFNDNITKNNCKKINIKRVSFNNSCYNDNIIETETDTYYNSYQNLLKEKNLLYLKYSSLVKENDKLKIDNKNLFEKYIIINNKLADFHLKELQI